MADYRNRPPVDAPRSRFPDGFSWGEVAGVTLALIAIAAGLVLVGVLVRPA